MPVQQWLFELVPGTIDTYYITSMGRPTCRRFLSVQNCAGDNRVDLWDQKADINRFQLIPTGAQDQFLIRAVGRASAGCSSWVTAQDCLGSDLVSVSNANPTRQAWRIVRSWS